MTRVRTILDAVGRVHECGARSCLCLHALAFALGWACIGMAQAQGLPDLYDAARASNALYLVAKAQAEAAPHRAAQADALRRPSAGLNGDVTRSIVQGSDGFSRGGINSSLSMSGRQPLFNPADQATIGQAQRQLELSRYDLELAEQDLILRVAQAYFDVLAAQDAAATTGASRAAISEQVASAKGKFEAGNGTVTDVREAQARFDLMVSQEILAVNDLRTKRIALDRVVGRRNVEPRPLATPFDLPPLAPPSMSDWVARADAEHPNIKRAQLALEVAWLETQKAAAGHLPTADAVASLSASQQAGSGTSFSGTFRNASLGVQVSLPLFSGYSVENRIKETKVLQSKSRNELEDARQTVMQATQQAYLAVQSGLSQVKALEAAEASSQLALEAAQMGHRLGVRVTLDVLNAQTQLYTTRRDLARARYDAVLAGLRLRQAAGRVGPADVLAVSGLLVK